MELQKKVIKRYRELNPELSVRQMAKDTGIQTTRLFRLLKGQEMKLREYEAFEQAIIKKKTVGECYTDAYSLFDQCLLKLPPQGLESLIFQLNKFSKLANFINQ